MKQIYSYIVLSLALFFLSGNKSVAQDTIFLRNNMVITGKVIKVSIETISYKKSEILDTFTYMVQIEDVRSIHYASRLVVTFDLYTRKKKKLYAAGEPGKLSFFENNYYFGSKQLREKELKAILFAANDENIRELVSKSSQQRKMQYFGFVAIPTALAAFVCLTFASTDSGLLAPPEEDRRGLKIAGVSSAAVAGVFWGSSITFKIKGKKNLNEAAKLFIQKY